MDKIVPTSEPPTATVAEQLDNIWLAWSVGRLSLNEAVAQIRELVDVSEYDATNLLTHEVEPSVRFAVLPTTKSNLLYEDPPGWHFGWGWTIAGVLIIVAAIAWSVLS